MSVTVGGRKFMSERIFMSKTKIVKLHTESYSILRYIYNINIGTTTAENVAGLLDVGK